MSRSSFRVRVLPRVPTNIVGTNGDKAQLDVGTYSYVISPDYPSLVVAPATSNLPTTFVRVYDFSTGMYTRVSLSNLADNIQAGVLGPNLTGIKALSVDTDKVPYFIDSSGNAATYTVSPYVRSISNAIDAPSYLAAIGASADLVGTVQDLSLLNLPATTTAIRFSGYAVAGDGGDWPLAVEVTNTGTLQPWQRQSNGGTRRWQLKTDIYKLEYFGGISGSDSTTAYINTCAAIAALGGGVLALHGKYNITQGVVLNNTAIFVYGAVPNSALIDVGIASGNYILSIVNADYSTPVAFENFSFITSQNSITNALSVEFGVFDAEFNRIPSRFRMSNIDIRGRDLSNVGLQLQGFLNGVNLTNVHRPVCENVIISGQGGNAFQNDAPTTNTLMNTGFQLTSTYDMSDPFKRASPTDPVFRDCQVYSARFAFYVRGHWEGLIFDHCLGVLVNVAFDIAANTPPGVGGVSFPWLLMRDCHANVFQDCVKIVEYFDVVIAGAQLHKWSYAPTGYVSTAISLTSCPRIAINGGTIFNLTQGGQNQQFNGIYINNCLGGVIDKPQFSGVTMGVQYAGTTVDMVYTRGVWRDIPTFGPTPFEYFDPTNGSGNRRKGVPLALTASSAAVTIQNTTTDLIAINLGTVFAGDEFIIENEVIAQKDANTEPVTMTISAQSGSTAVISMLGSTNFVQYQVYAQGSFSFGQSHHIRLKVLQAGSLTVLLQGKCIGGTAAISTGNAKIYGELAA